MGRVNTMLDKIPQIKGSRTIGWAAVCTAINSVVLPALIAFDWSLFFDDQTKALIVMVLGMIEGVVAVMLRFDTTGPVDHE